MEPGNHSYRIEFAYPHAFAAGLKKLPNHVSDAVQLAIREILTIKGLELAETEWLKKVSGSVWELRVGKTTTAVYSKAGIEKPMGINHTKILVRVFCSFQGGKLIVLLSAYDKKSDDSPSRQREEIAKANRILSKWIENRR